MPKKEWTEEDRKAFGEKIKATREAKKELLVEAVATDETGAVPDANDTVTLSADQYQALLDRLTAVESKPVADIPPTPQSVQPLGAHQDAAGRPMGVTEKYSVDPAHYIDPIEELFVLFDRKPSLRRYALRTNYDLQWSVSPTKYQTAFGTWYIEPRFELVVLRRRYDDETGEERTDSKIILGRDSFFEDPASNLLEADQAGINYTDMSASEFAEHMRMYRYEKFIVETINPPRRSAGKPSTKRQEVIGGRPYEIEEGNRLA